MSTLWIPPDVRPVKTMWNQAITAAQHAVHALVSDLVSGIDAAVAQDAARHVQLDIGPEVHFVEGAALFLVAGSAHAVLVRKVLQAALPGLVADRAIQRVVDQQHFHDAFAGIQYIFVSSILYHHAILYRRNARCNQFRHRARILGRTLRYFYKAYTAFTATALKWSIVTHGRWHNMSTDLPGGLKDGSSIFYLYLNAIECYFSHFIFRCSFIVARLV